MKQGFVGNLFEVKTILFICSIFIRVGRFIDKTEIDFSFDKNRKKSGKYLKLAEIAAAYKQFIFCTLAYFRCV
jgi:hypothetical protein